MNLKQSNSLITILLNFIICTLVICNIALLFHNFSLNIFKKRNIITKPILLNSSYTKKIEVSTPKSLDFEETPRHLPPPPQDINYTENELEEAIAGLHIPTWSRSYVKCDDPRSEVTCTQVVLAWRCLNSWAKYIESTKFEDRNHFIMQHLYDGVGNRFSTDTTTFIIALMLNRSYIMESSYPQGNKMVFGQAFEFHPDVLMRKDEVDEYFKREGDRIRSNIQTFDLWYLYDYNVENKKKILYVDYLLYATMAYTHNQLSEFSRKNFGMHAAYFVCNFLMRLPQKSIEKAKKTFEKVPAGYRIFGVHLRFQHAGQFYSHNITRTLEVVIPFLKRKLEEKPTIFAFASDSSKMEQEFRKHFGKHMITVDTIRIADYDHDSALNDIAMLEMCDECLLSYRSTFSYVCAMRMGKRAWFVEKEADHVFQASNSQATVVSALFHNWDVNDWQLNRRVHVNERNEEALRYYCKYFLV
ncbi:hypothetical protein TVAG_185380 [Trichomonas vaginalis G3]|uniref:Uncharacterized protein n=1 Tax=Trichomonas vaginalis (strain ATCC PRA-98 / G3) TaxID=412133 RepID=A2D8I3_TRIV3|nr:xyloglucan biosynthetic process [Trichomonas vaginalis G3]EAY23232.1 hypothetical protein TVAG_185380 [Trichomonas vaginalis G3]KAI5534119.1 xyloglucan biosynthetic process [Trichomonas vaginalis G3]|eukprot:XP_001584218.1 hypothetical protein [Trichomonas vaginalis G3]